MTNNPNECVANSMDFLIDEDMDIIPLMNFPDMYVANSVDFLVERETADIIPLMNYANMYAPNSVRLLVTPEPPVIHGYKWSLSVPSFVCTPPFAKRNI